MSTTPLRRISWPVGDHSSPDSLVSPEWLVCNGLGGYASGTVSGAITRRYHGVLIAALPAPLGRVVMLNHLAEQIRLDGRRYEIGVKERVGDSPDAEGTGFLVEFRLEAGLPVWRYDVDGVILEKRIFLTYMQNTVHVTYELSEGADVVEVALRPSVNFRPQETPVGEPFGRPYEFHALAERYEIALQGSDLPTLRLRLRAEDAAFTLKHKRIDEVLYQVEESRGYEARGDLWSPGYYRFALRRGSRAALVASTEPWDIVEVLDSEQAMASELARRRRLVARALPPAQTGLSAELVLAADQFIIAPAGRIEETARARAQGDEVRTVIAGYHWFTDWGRDTMISLEGLTLVTGRQVEAGYILRTFAHYVRDGLIPNMFPERQTEGLYHTADATLWFFHAISRYLAWCGDELTLSMLYPTLQTIIECHVRGTRFGIRVDPHDGLLTQGAPGYQLTWMDAKVDDWVVTPRRGKAVEINALWYNALRLMEGWAERLGSDKAGEYRAAADRAYRSFNERFWSPGHRHLFDVIDTEEGADDARCRPNQILAVALPHPVLAENRWEAVVDVVRDRLLTPVGLRSLVAEDPDFKPRYFGDLRARDAAYHQGTVWGWLIGPFVDAWMRVHPEDESVARRAVSDFESHLDAACLGSVSEVFDAEPPYTARGCIAQAWSVAELLRVRVKLASPPSSASEASGARACPARGAG
jgi:predicted glycogen debranching enzyme